MANTKTELEDFPLQNHGGLTISRFKTYKLAIDTVDTYFEVHAPEAGRFCAIAGFSYAEANAHNLTVAFGAASSEVDHQVYELAANSGIFHPLGSGLMVIGPEGEPLTIKSSAALSLVWLAVVEFKQVPSASLI